MANAGVLYISYDGMTDNLGQSQVIPYLIGLTQKGYNVHILSCEKPATFQNRKEHIQSIFDNANIRWHPISYTSKPPVISTLKDIHSLKKEARKIIQDSANNIQIVHCRSYISAHVGMYCQRKFGLPWLFDMRGFWTDERIEGGIWNLQNPLFALIYKYFKSAERKFVSQAQHIISLTQNGANEIRSWKAWQTNSRPISVIPCCADLEHFSAAKVSEQKQSLRNALNIPDNAFVLSYLGSFGTWYMTDEMFDFFKVLHSQNSEAIFLCITPDNPITLNEIAKKKNIPTSAIRIIKVNREDVPAYASLSNWSIFFIKPVFSKRASSPTKMGELLSLGIPLVCNSGVGDVDSIMEKCEQGFVVSQFSTNEYAEISRKISNTKVVKHKQLRAVAQEVYSLEKGVERYAIVYESILKNR